MYTSAVLPKSLGNISVIMFSYTYDGTFGAVSERPTAALIVAGSIPAQNKYFYAWLFV